MCAICGVTASPAGSAAPISTLHPAPVIAIIIDDMGYRLADCLSSLDLPGPVAYSFLPHTPHAPRLLREAQLRGKDVFLHVPMEAIHHNHLLGPGALRLDMPRDEYLQVLDADLKAVPGALGVNNHMGSLLTQQTQPMGWLMEFLRRRGLFFVDSKTSLDSVALEVAASYGIKVAARDVFLDNEPRISYITQQFEQLLSQARKTGAALGIAHPHGRTNAALQRLLAGSARSGVRLVSLREFIDIKSRLQNRRVELNSR